MLLLKKRNVISPPLHWLSGVLGGDPRSSGGVVGTKTRCGGEGGGGPGGVPGARPEEEEGAEDAEGGDNAVVGDKCAQASWISGTEAQDPGSPMDILAQEPECLAVHC